MAEFFFLTRVTEMIMTQRNDIVGIIKKKNWWTILIGLIDWLIERAWAFKAADSKTAAQAYNKRTIIIRWCRD